MTSLLSIKDLARKMQLTPKSVIRWARRLNVPPTIPGYASHRWSEADASKLLKAWEKFWTRYNEDRKSNRR